MDIEQELKEITNPKCTVCGKTLKHIPAGKSIREDILGRKVEREYDEFWVCPDNECGSKYNKWRIK